MLSGQITESESALYVTRVLVNGVQREILSVDLDREITSDLPAQVVSGTGIQQATASVEWAGEELETGGRSPWNPSLGWIPTEGDRVQIFVSDGVSEWQRAEMRVDRSSGSIGGGIASTLVDAIDDFSATVNIPALMGHMPPLEDGGPWRRVGLSTLYHTNEALRVAGFYTTPKREFNSVLDVPMQGSMWPSKGTVSFCQQQTDNLLSPLSHAAEWGAARSDFTARYIPSFQNTISANLQMTIMVSSNHAGIATFDAMYGTARIRMRIDGTRAVQAYLGSTLVASLPAAQTSGAKIFSLLVKGSTWTLKLDNGATATGTQAVSSVTEKLSEIIIAALPNARVAAAQVSHPTAVTHEFSSLNFVATARVSVGNLGIGNGALPAVTNQSALELLSTIGEAKLQPMWIDETGKVQVVASDTLRNQAVVRDLTTLDDIFEMTWERSLLSSRSKVIAQYQEPSITARLNASVEVWSSTGSDVLASGEIREDIVSPPSGEDWILVDDTLQVPGLHTLELINKGVGSVGGGVYTDGVNEQWAALPAVNKLAVTMAKISANEWKITNTAKTLEAGHQVELRTFSEQFVGNTGLWPYWWGKELPIVRAKARVQWTDKERSPNIAGTKGPELTVNLGPWATGFQGSETVAVDAISSFIAEQVMNPQPTIQGLRIVPDPRLQLGDVVTVSSPRLLGVTLRCLVVGLSENFSPSDYGQTLFLRVISVITNRLTYEQFAKAWPDASNYTSLSTAWEAISTYQDFNENPLKGSM